MSTAKKPASGVYKIVLDRAGFFDRGTIRGFLFVYAANVPMFFYLKSIISTMKISGEPGGIMPMALLP